MGHTVRLIAPQLVKPFVSGGLSMEYGIIIPQGIDQSRKRIPEIIEDELAKLRLEPIFSTVLVYWISESPILASASLFIESIEYPWQMRQ